MPIVSIIIPCYNRFELLQRTLKSIFLQDYQNYEIIIIDDASHEPLLKKIDKSFKCYKQDCKVFYLEKNVGPGLSRKIGLENAQGKYIQFLDSDDEILPKKLNLQVSHLEKENSLIMTYAMTISGEKIDNMKILGRSNINFNRILPYTLDRIIWTTSSCLWRECLIKADWWYPFYAAEDALFDVMAGINDLPIAKTPSNEPLVRKWINDEGLSKNIMIDINIQREIIKSLDIMNNVFNEIEFNQELLNVLGQLYEKKVMFFLVNRKYEDAFYCINKVLELSKNTSIILKILKIFYAYYPSNIWFKLLRKYYWLKKKSIFL